jgi:hypothetical protein
LRAAISCYGPPEQLLTDNARVFTGRFFAPPVEVLFDAICREHGIEHLLTLPRSPTTTGKIERFHRTLRAEFDTRQIFTSLQVAQQALDEWVGYYNTARPHQALNDATPAERFSLARDTADSRSSSATPVAPTRAVINSARATDRDGDGWISRRVGPNGVVCVSWQQVTRKIAEKSRSRSDLSQSREICRNSSLGGVVLFLLNQRCVRIEDGGR